MENQVRTQVEENYENLMPLYYIVRQKKKKKSCSETKFNLRLELQGVQSSLSRANDANLRKLLIGL